MKLTQCHICSKEITDGTCRYCLLQLGLNNPGGQKSFAGRSYPNASAPTAAERFVRAGVLPKFGDYELESEIAPGGMGVVYEARQLSLQRKVAVKLIVAGQLATPESVQRFRLEAQAAARLHHPGIVPIYEIGEFETQHFFSMELIDGASLAECLDDFVLRPDFSAPQRRQQERCIAELLARVARALEFAHQRGVLHRDLKPSNILIDQRGEPRLTDFGLAKLVGREAGGLTLSSAVLGTPGYLAPEQASRSESEVTTAADVYGLGATLYELLTGRPPFVGATAISTMMMSIDKPPIPPRQINPVVHRDLETIALRCLEKVPEKRYRSAAAVADEFERFCRGEPIVARPVGKSEHVWRWCRKNPMLATALAVLMLTFAVGAVAVFSQWKRAERANVALTSTVADLQLGTIDDLLEKGQASRALASLASILREHGGDAKCVMLAVSILEQHRFPVPAGPTIRHPDGRGLSIARLSPDEKRIVTASFDGTARLWDSATSSETTPPLLHEAPVTWAEFSPDGLTVATSSEDKTVRAWDVSTGQAKCQPARLIDVVTKVHFSANGQLLLALTKNGTATLLQSGDLKVITGPISHDGAIVSAGFRSGGACFFTAQSAGNNSCIRTWSTADGHEIARLPTNPMQSADVRKDLGRATFAGTDSPAWVVDFPSGANRREIVSADGIIQRVRFNPAGDRIAATSYHQWARVFDAGTGLPITAKFPHSYSLQGAEFCHDGRELVTWSRDSTAQVWDIEADRPFCEPMRNVNRVEYAEAGSASDDGDVFLTTQSHLARPATTKTGACQLWKVVDRQNPKSRTFARLSPGYDNGTLSPDGKLVALGTVVTAAGTEDVQVIDLATGKSAFGPIVVKGAAWGIFFTPDGSRLITISSTGQVAVWSVPSGKLVAEPVQVKTTVMPSEMSPDGKLIATGSTDDIVRLWDTSTGRIVREINHGEDVRCIAFSNDGRFIASGGADMAVRVWEVATGKLVRELTGHQNEVISVFFSPDGRKLVTASLDFTARIWDAATGKTLFRLPHRGDVLDVAFSGDGKYVATASRDRTAVIWDASTGEPHGRSLLHPFAVRNVRFSPDGSKLWTVGFKGIRVWDVATGHPLSVVIRHTMVDGTAFQCTPGRFAFTPDASGVLVVTDSTQAGLYYVSEPKGPAPAWFAELLEAVAGEHFPSGVDRPEPVPASEFLRLEAAIELSQNADEYTAWAKQWLRGAKPASGD